MIRRRRRCLPIPSDSSDDGSPQPRKQLRTSSHSRNERLAANTLPNTSTCKRQVQRQHRGSSSDSSYVVSPRKIRRKIYIDTSEGSSSSESEESSYQPRRRSVRLLSVNNTSVSNAGASGVSSHRLCGVRNQILTRNSVLRMEITESSNYRNVVEDKTWFKRQEDDSESSDNSLVISPASRRKTHRICSSEELSSDENEEILNARIRGALRALSDYETGDNSDIAHQRSANPMRDTRDQIHGLTTERGERAVSSSSDDSSIQIRPRLRRKRRSNTIISSDSSDSGLPVWFGRSRKRMRLCSSDESDSRNSTVRERNRRTGRRNRITDSSIGTTNRATSSGRQQASREVQPRNNQEPRPSVSPLNGRRRYLADQSTTDSESVLSIDLHDSDLEHMRNVIGTIRHRATDNDDDNMLGSSANVNLESEVGNKALSSLKISSPSKTSLGNCSDSDGESEKCPICLARFNLQEIGSPATCDHSFCTVCIQEWAKNNNTCPVDRQVFTSIIVRAHIQGKVIREIPLPDLPPRTMYEDWWESLNVDLGLDLSDDIVTSNYDSDGDGPDEICCVCCLSSFSDNMINCDDCMRVYHLECLNPPLRYVPVHNWYCPPCVEADRQYNSV